MICTILSKRGASASPVGTVLALGCFDGFHRGHRALIEAARTLAKEHGAHLAIWSPAGLKKSGGRLYTREQSLALAASLGVDLFVEEDFGEICALDGKAFFERYILEKYRPLALVCGENFRFGQGARCSVNELSAFCKDADLTLCICPSVMDEEGQTVSSTAVKTALAAGDVSLGKTLLGAAYQLTAPVSKGRQVGRTLGFPTLNLPLPDSCPLRYGVYFAEVQAGNGRYPAIVNVGVHPTFGEDAQPVLEAHLLSAPTAPIVYGDVCTVSFLSFRRPEMKFSSPEELQKTVFEDIQAAKERFGMG